MLQIKDLSVKIEDKNVLDKITINFQPGKNYCILWKNWSWKSSLALTIMWHPKYEILDGEIYIDSKSILDMEAHERASEWIFLAFQNIPEIKGVKLFEFLRTIYSAKIWENLSFIKFKKIIIQHMEELHIDTEFLWRDLNVGFSWWERRKIEILQLKLLEPKYIFLDEVDSWLDVDAFKSVAQLIQDLNNKDNCFIVITHYFTILDYIPVDHVLVLKDWKMHSQWDKAMAMMIKEHWFKSLEDA